MSRAGFALASWAFLVTMFGTTLPTPLYPIFQQRYGFGELLVTVIFAIYAFGVIAGLLLFGALSDEVGRRPVLAAGLAFSAASAVLFLFASSLVPIYAGRILSGFSAGIFTGTATAALVDLAPRGNRRLATQIAVVANLGGLGLGTLAAGCPLPSISVFWGLPSSRSRLLPRRWSAAASASGCSGSPSRRR